MLPWPIWRPPPPPQRHPGHVPPWLPPYSYIPVGNTKTAIRPKKWSNDNNRPTCLCRPYLFISVVSYLHSKNISFGEFKVEPFQTFGVEWLVSPMRTCDRGCVCKYVWCVSVFVCVVCGCTHERPFAPYWLLWVYVTALLATFSLWDTCS